MAFPIGSMGKKVNVMLESWLTENLIKIFSQVQYSLLSLLYIRDINLCIITKIHKTQTHNKYYVTNNGYENIKKS